MQFTIDGRALVPLVVLVLCIAAKWFHRTKRDP